MTRVLVIDEDRKLCRLLEEHLVREGMVVNFAHDAKSGLRSALSGQHDLVVLDVNLREFAGLHVVRQLRTHSRIGVVALSPRGEEADKIIGLESGADDYLAKPCNLRELVARIRAVSRRLTPSLVPDPPKCLTVGDLSLDEGTRTCRRNGEVVDLTSGEFDLLLALLHWSGHAVHRNDLYKSVLNREYSPSDRSIDVRVSKL